MGANAVIGLVIDMCELSGKGVLASANATAVYVIPKEYDRLVTEQKEKKRLEEEKEREAKEQMA